MDENKTMALLEKASRSATRNRFIVIVLVASSVLGFMSFWNSRSDSWLRLRLEKYKSVREFDYLSLEKEGALIGDKEKEDFQELKSFLKEQDIERGDDFIVDSKIGDLEDSWVENFLLVRIPFFGVSFDINDLGVIGGFAMSIVVFLLFLGLSREKSNLDFVFNHIRECYPSEKQTFFFNYLAMSQILTIPPIGSIKKWVTISAKIFYFLPVFVYSLIWVHDLYSLKKGLEISTTNTAVSTSVSSLFLLLIVFFSYSCFSLSIDIDRSWSIRDGEGN